LSNEAADAYRVSVDFITCRGHGMCAYYLPSHIGLDEWGYPIVTNERLAPGELRDGKRAALMCPELALKIEKIQERARAAR
jgi:ferredoxin